jgi:hypothetical protein
MNQQPLDLNPLPSERRLYSSPRLCQQPIFCCTTGISLPIGTTGFENPIEGMDFLEEQQ